MDKFIKLNGEKLPLLFNSYAFFTFMDEKDIPMENMMQLIGKFSNLFELTYIGVCQGIKANGKQYEVSKQDFCEQLSSYPKSLAYATKYITTELTRFMEEFGKAQEKLEEGEEKKK